MSRVPPVRSVERAFDLLELTADAQGAVTLSDLCARSGLPQATIHRILQSLVSQGYVRQDSSRRYELGPRLIRLGETASRGLAQWVKPYLRELVDAIGETANMAMLDGAQIVYMAQVASPHQMRMFTEVGRHVSAHCTGVGKALLSTLPDDEIRAMVARTGLEARTEHTIVDVEDLLVELKLCRERGYAVDNGEQEIGVRCVATPVLTAATRLAISVSGPDGRIDTRRVPEIAPILLRVAERARQTLLDQSRGEQ
jgi:IclR family acetate operon transcriptional repressor